MADGRHTVPRLVYRYLSGRPLDGRAGYPYLRAGAGRLAGWQRQAWRVGAPVIAAMSTALPDDGVTTLSGLAIAAAVSGHHHLAHRRFHREYVNPTLAAMSPALGVHESGIRLHVDPSLGSLTKRLAKPLSPAEEAMRRWYGEHVEPAVRWLPDRVQCGAWWVQRKARPVTKRLEVLRRPRAEDPGPRIELQVDTPYLMPDQRLMVDAIINSKIPVAELTGAWDQVGPRISARWTVRKRPPTLVEYAQVVAHIDGLKEWEFYVGQSSDNLPFVLSLHEDSPHIAVSAGSGAGKSVLAMLLAVQVLRRGGRVLILDRKGSHRWAIGVAGIDYCTKPAQMHEALIREAALADQRNDLALHEEDDWDPGPRHLVICEELNATIGQLTNYWADVREKGEPKKSPAVAALADLLFMGRSAKVNVLAIAQMLTARAIGGPEARENFGVRCLARYTKNAWKMLVPEAAMPRASRTLGRWQAVIGGQATEVQVAYLTSSQARALARPAAGLEEPLSRQGDNPGDMLTLKDACAAGVLPWSYEATKKRMQRRVGDVPIPRSRQAGVDLYRWEDLKQWVDSCRSAAAS